MKKKLKIITITNILLLIISLIILRYSEILRGQNPLYVTLKMIGWGLLSWSILGSLINTLFIYFDYKANWKQNIGWFSLSLSPLLFFSGVIIYIYIS